MWRGPAPGGDGGGGDESGPEPEASGPNFMSERQGDAVWPDQASFSAFGAALGPPLETPTMAGRSTRSAIT